MPNENNLGASFSIDTTALKAGLAQANRLIRESESEFKAAAAGMDDWTKSEEGLTKKIKSLNDITAIQQKKVDALQKEYDELIRNGLDPASKEATELRTKINNETAAMEKNKKQAADLEDALNGFKEEAKKTGKTVDEVAQGLDDLDDKAKDAGDGFTVAKGAVATFIGNGLTALVGACKNAITSVLGLAESTREYRTELSKIETAASVAGASTDYIKDKWHDMGAVLGDEGAVAEGLNNLMAAGFTTQKEMDAITKHLEGAAIKWKDTLKFEGLSDGLQETLATGAAVGSFGEMLERSGVNLETFNGGLAKCTTEADKQNYILDQLSKLGLAEVSDAYREQNADLINANKANSEYNDNMAALGEKIEPITTKIREGFNKILEKVLELVDGVDLNAFGEKISKTFDKFINDILPKIVDGLTWIIENKDGLIAGIVGIGAAFAAFKVVSLIQGVVSALNGMTVAQYALNLAMSMNPIGLIVAAIAGLVAAFVVLWNKCDGFRNFWIGLWDGLKKAVGVVVDWIKENWKTMLLFLTNPLAGVFKYCYEHFEGFRNFVDNIVKNVKQFFVDLWEGIKNGAKSVIDWVKNNWQSIVAFLINPLAGIFKYLWDNFDGFRNFFLGIGAWINDNVIKPVAKFFVDLWNGIKTGASNLWNGLKNIFSTVSNWFNSTVIQPVKNVFTGLWNGLKNGASQAWNGIKSVFSSVATFFKNIFTNAWQGVKNVFSTGGKIFDGIKDGIVSAFKNVVNAIIRGINKVVSVPFNAINKVLGRVRNVSIAGISPFKNLISNINAPQIPLLAKGGIVRKATKAIVGEDGPEAVLPLKNNTGYLKEFAKEIAAELGQGVVVNQTNNYSQAHSRYELWKSEQNIKSAVKLGLLGGY